MREIPCASFRQQGSRIQIKGKIMEIASAIERSGTVYIYDLKGHLLATVSAGNGPDDGLIGFTGRSVSVRRGIMIYVYDARGRLTGTAPAR